MKKIVTIVGARPQFVKMALISEALKELKVKEIIVHTGQHYNKNLSDIFFKELKIPRPDYNLNVGSGTHAEQVAKMLTGIEKILVKENPSIVLVYGDTNSTLAGALAASKLGITIAHVEAGLRSLRSDMPEEINRVVTDSISNIFFSPTKEAISNLKKEGKYENVFLVGDVMFDSINRFAKYLNFKVFYLDNYILCTIHRQENTDSKKKLKEIFKGLGMIKEEIIMPIHPRTFKSLDKFKIRVPDNVKLIEPVGYFDMLRYEKKAAMIITDSGGVQKEAMIFAVPCITLRNETEWVETVKSGMNILAGSSAKKIVMAFRKFRKFSPKKNLGLKYYGDGTSYKKIAKILYNKLKAL